MFNSRACLIHLVAICLMPSVCWIRVVNDGTQGETKKVPWIEWTSELGGPGGKLFRFVSCVRARGAYVRSDLGENPCPGAFPFPFWPREVFPFPSALQGPIQLQLALSVWIYMCFLSIHGKMLKTDNSLWVAVQKAYVQLFSSKSNTAPQWSTVFSRPKINNFWRVFRLFCWSSDCS